MSGWRGKERKWDLAFSQERSDDDPQRQHNSTVIMAQQQFTARTTSQNDQMESLFLFATLLFFRSNFDIKLKQLHLVSFASHLAPIHISVSHTIYHYHYHYFNAAWASIICQYSFCVSLLSILNSISKIVCHPMVS